MSQEFISAGKVWLCLLSQCDQASESAEVSMYKNVCSRVFFNHQKLDCIPLTGEYTLSHRRYSVSWKMILTCWMRNEIKYIVIDYFWGMFRNS